MDTYSDEKREVQESEAKERLEIREDAFARYMEMLLNRATHAYEILKENDVDTPEEEEDEEEEDEEEVEEEDE